MKKLVIAVAIVCVAVASQAASFRWTASSVTDITGQDSYSGALTIFVVDKDDTSAVIGTYSGTMTDGAFDIVDGGDEIVQGVTYKTYYTMTDSQGNVFTSAIKSKKATSPANASIAFANAGTWTPAPEPTSGLLLLLGVAGLALRRKRM